MKLTKEKNKNPIIKFIVISGLAVLLSVILLVARSGSLALSPDRILKGVRIGGQDYSALNRKEAAGKLGRLQEHIAGKEVIFTCGNKKKKVQIRELDVTINLDQTIDKAMSIGRRGNIWVKWQERRRLSSKGIDISPIYRLNEEKLNRLACELAGDKQSEAEDARFIINEDDKVEIKPERIGNEVDIRDMAIKVTEAASKTGHAEISLKFEKILPRITKRDLEAVDINGLLSAYTTYFDPKATNRVYNINVAADAFNDLLIKPGETVSFNKVVGPRDEKAGYRQAPVIVNDELIDGLGGGVCQVSSTLYNCVLLAGLEIVERSNHSIPVGYVPLGRDATVDFNNMDLKFRNDTEKYLLIKSLVKDNGVTFKIYGQSSLKKEVVIETIVQKVYEPGVLYEDDPGLEKGKEVVKQEGKKGFEVKSWQIIRAGAKETRRELPISVYNARNRVVAVGRKEFSTTIVPVPEVGG